MLRIRSSSAILRSLEQRDLSSRFSPQQLAIRLELAKSDSIYKQVALLDKLPSVPGIYTAEIAKNMEMANEQYANFVSTLRKVADGIVEVPSEGFDLDIAALGDLALTIDSRVILAKSAEEEKAEGRIQGLGKFLESKGFEVCNMPNEALFEPSDCIVSGRVIHVIMTGRTNELALHYLQCFLPSFSIIPIRFRSEIPHAQKLQLEQLTGEKLKDFKTFKSIGSSVGPRTIAFEDTLYGQAIGGVLSANSGLSNNLRKAGYTLNFVTIPSRVAAGVLHIKDTLIVQPESVCPESFETLAAYAEMEQLKLAPVDTSLFASNGITPSRLCIPLFGKKE